jgi:hypothetical protein
MLICFLKHLVNQFISLKLFTNTARHDIQSISVFFKEKYLIDWVELNLPKHKIHEVVLKVSEADQYEAHVEEAEGFEEPDINQSSNYRGD